MTESAGDGFAAYMVKRGHRENPTPFGRLERCSLIYVGTPYSKWPAGINDAFIEACKLTARLLSDGLKVYSPIAHTHPIAIYGALDPLDHNIWLPFDAAMMDAADAMIVATMDGWNESKGIDHEIQVFRKAGKPIYALNPKTMEITEFK